VWVTIGPWVTQIRPSDGSVLRTITTTAVSAGIAFDGANVWVANYDGSSISKM
jgi:hypothetical protein